MKDVINGILEEPGVYFFINQKKEIIYIGKSVNLKKRVTSHFRDGKDQVFKKVVFENGLKKAPMGVWDYTERYLEVVPSLIYNQELKKKNKIVSKTKEIKFIITDNEDEALTLEGCLISVFRPIVNKQHWKYPLIEITLGEEVPRILTSYQALLPDSFIFGPFNIASDIDLAMEGFLLIIPICNAPNTIKPGGRYPQSCFKHQINRCIAPCKNSKWDKKQYNHFVKEFIFELENKGNGVIKKLEMMMNEETNNENYEGAAALRDRINAIKELFSTKAIPIVLMKYYKEINEIVGESFDYAKIIDKIVTNNGNNKK